MNEERQKLMELSQSFASIEQNYQKAKADYDMAKTAPASSDNAITQDKLDACMQACFAAIRNVHDRMDNMSRNMWNYQDSHAEGHLPPIKTPEGMNKALAALGQSENYEAKKKTIFASKDLFEIKDSNKR